ncbi:MAG: hypothetical protein LBH04_08940 [Tannerellaceae bacterium]|nr:hypothetical protein [Tannerellaceae bacterium]
MPSPALVRLHPRALPSMAAGETVSQQGFPLLHSARGEAHNENKKKFSFTCRQI